MRQPLSPRQKQVLEHLAQGHSRQQTANHLGITVNTVATHIKAAKWALRATNTRHAVAKAIRTNQIP